MLKHSQSSSSFSTRGRKKSQIVSEDSFCNVPLLTSSRRNTLSPSSDPPSPSKSLPIPSSPSLRKLALLSTYISCACSKESLHQIDESTDRPSHLAPTFVDKQETNATHSSDSDTKLRRHYSKLKKAMNRTSVNSQVRAQSFPPNDIDIKELDRDTPHPTLTLPLPLQHLNTGLGWPDELGVRSESQPIPHRPWLADGGTFSVSSQRTTWSQPSRPASRQSIRDTPPSRDFFNVQDESLALQTPLTVLETGQSRLESFTEWTMSSVIFAEPDQSALRRNTSQIKFREHLEDSQPPQVNLQVRASDDWAATVLKVLDQTNDACP